MPWVSGENSLCGWSGNRTHRVYLLRRWRDGPRRVCIGLNPSTADETTDDRTVDKLIRWADRDGFGSFVMLNLFTIRATDPQEMLAADEPVCFGADGFIEHWAHRADEILCCWGNHGTHRNRDAEVVMMLLPHRAKVRYLQARNGDARGFTKQGQPPHPLYLGNSTPILNWLDGSAMQYPRSDKQ